MINIKKDALFNTVTSNQNAINNHENFEYNINLANNAIEKGDWNAAYPYLKSAVEMNPNYAQGYNHLGVYYTRNKKYQEAINNFKKALQIDFSLTEAHYNLAYLHMDRKEYTTALSYLKEVVLVNPDDYETYYLMGVCCIQSNMEKEAEAFLSEAYRLKPEHVSTAMKLCKLLIKNGDYSKAKNILLYTHMNDPSLPEANLLLGIIYKLQKKYTRAMDYLRKTLLKDKNNTEAYNLIGECCVESGMDKQAETFFSMAVKLDCFYTEAFYNLGNIYYRQKKYENAIYTLEEYLKTKEASDTINALWNENNGIDNEKIVSLYNLLGHCYNAVKNLNKARTIWEKSLAIQPQQQDIKKALAELPQPLHKRISLVID
ncbi:MAG: tetratricopeptide repeat protein [Candidatus Brocadiaceae bacterium]|nr:tetratricopeptide repeat protein [Candidatus Brocadiaceae bacterium]